MIVEGDAHVQVVAMLQGRRLLPWETGVGGAAALGGALGVLAGPVLQLLQRDPARRPSMARFHEACTAVFGGGG